MRYYRTRKSAWDVREGDLLETELTGVTVYERVAGVRRFLIRREGEPAAKNVSHVVLTLDDRETPLMIRGDQLVNIQREKAVA